MRTFYLYAIDFHYGGIRRVSVLRQCKATINGAPTISSILTQIQNAFGVQFLNLKDVYPISVQTVVDTYGSNTKYPDEETNEFVSKANIISAFGLDWDEADTYIVVQEASL